MRTRGCLLAVFVAALAVPSAAAADITIGNVTQPGAGTLDVSTADACPSSPDEVIFSTGGSGLNSQFTVPSSASPLAVTHWQINVDGATPGTPVMLVVLRLATSPTISLTVVGVDTETVPTPLPADKIASFAMSSPIPVEAGDEVAVYADGTTGTGLTCAWDGGPTSSMLNVESEEVAAPPAVGDSLPVSGGAGFSESSAVGNVSATLGTLAYDAGLSLSAGPSNAVVGQPAVLTATVTNHGPFNGLITFTDPVPTGLTVDYAAVSSGSCSTNTAVNIVTCTLANVAVGQSEKIGIVVTPKSAQSFSDAGTLAIVSGATDPNPANNSATATLNVSSGAPAARCVVPKLGGASLALTKKLLGLLDCKAGKVKKATSKSVAKGDVISTSPGAGTYAAGTSVAITESSGKPKPKPKKKKHSARR
jgi:uncharacterized repeat protein (TIGR01451 family)